MGKKLWIWQQDNASIHTACKFFDCFHEEEVSTSDWPARSPDLNLIENVWSMLQDKVYESGQFNKKEQLLAEIKRCAKLIPTQHIKNLYTSMNKRLLTVVEKKGNQI